MEKINYWSLNYKNAHTFYIAVSPSYPELIKVGITKGATKRLINLNSHKLGDVDDWSYKCLIKLGVGKAGPFETNILSRLKQYSYPLEYYSKSKDETSKEVLKTNLINVLNNFCSILHEHGYSIFEIYGVIQTCANSDESILNKYREELMNFRQQNIPFPLVPLAERIWVEYGILPTFHIGGSPKVLPNRQFKYQTNTSNHIDLS
ncbi:hypothetical protein I3271_10280 [Photobacterium leiognathi]|uniref:GIY-YIG nuclease family protein n=1 Tax=Photobacterium leiognathi TaxID=553611 RepID=UPI0002088B6C|nr:GIY-YIG nuclease family protein [Photobacterium leiognathi]MCG3885065.1 hypothetical protein [Photobacterium leiognathi]PSW49578.1 hypothetical protein CTM83_19270 [Photobacterium leiognathi subsp. mandapamensis]GAA05651.1 hypothetical protein PMSV_1763 [Photobacterium leiognathi subsp. mandapamensis svers.1.1.]